MRALREETDEQNTQRILSYLSGLLAEFLAAADGASAGGWRHCCAGHGEGADGEPEIGMVQRVPETALTRDGLAWLERVWRREEKVEGLTFAETDEIEMAMNLAVREVPGWSRS